MINDASARSLRLVILNLYINLSFVLLSIVNYLSLICDRASFDFSDAKLYHNISMKVFAGKSYYDSAKLELTRSGYPIAYLFNWRTPLYSYITGSYGNPQFNDFVIYIIPVLIVAMTFHVVRKELDTYTTFGSALFVAGYVGFCDDPDAIYFSEFLASLAIYMSIMLYLMDYRLSSIILGVFALFLRELSSIYCIAAMLISMIDRRGRDAIIWVIAVVCYLIHFALHSIEVIRRIPGGFHGFGWSRWLVFGGYSFIIKTARMNLILSYLPEWFVIVYLPLSIIGILQLKGVRFRLLKTVTIAYLLTFGVAGRNFNFYWGWFYSANLALGFPVFMRNVFRSGSGIRLYIMTLIHKYKYRRSIELEDL